MPVEALPPANPYLAGQFAPYLEHQLMLWKRGERDGDPLNIMELIAKDMTDDQLRAVLLHFASLRPEDATPEECFSARAGSKAPKLKGPSCPPEIEVAPARMGEGGEPE